jgi:hypothetical protein
LNDRSIGNGRAIPEKVSARPLNQFFYSLVRQTRIDKLSMLITVILFFALVTLLPIKWAAAFTEGKNAGLGACALASALAPALAALAFRMSPGGFNGVLLAYLAMVASYVSVLRIPAKSIVSFAVVVLALQLAAIAALISFNNGRLVIGF